MTEQLTVEAVYFAALALPDSERPAYLEKVCGDHEALRQCVEKMLAVQPMVGNFLEAGVNLPVTSDSEASGQTVDFGDPTARVDSILVGKYKLIEEIGAGGMGSVYMAQQTQPVKRTVAVKVIKAGMDSKAVLARFEAERQALAMMDHPNIARVLDAGTTDGGRPFFVMELVKGFPITQFCDDRKLTLRQRLELFVPVCQAIQHAHQKGIVHRDIKPSNVLVALYDDRAVPKVIDFGVAKAAGQSLTDLTLVTGFGAIIGTPEYMSPEQASLNNLDIDTRSDVYSLGVLLYELMTGSTPVDRKSLGKAAMLEILRIVREMEIPLASVRLSNRDTLVGVAANRGTEPAKLSRLMRGELDWLLHKALEKDRTRRYETANGLARDIQRYLADEVMEARPPSTSYRVRKFIRRNPLQLALAGAIALLMVGGTAVAWWQNEQANQRTAKDLRQQLVDQQRIATDNARLARNSEAVAGLLVQTAEALRAGDTVRADITLEAAKKRSTEGGAEEHLTRLGRLDADLFLLRDLDAIDQFRWTVVENKMPEPATVAMRVRDVLRRSGADLQTASLDDLEAWVKTSVVRDRILSALYLVLEKGPNQTGWSLLGRVDTDPFRNAVRDAIFANDPKLWLQLAQQPEALDQPPEFVGFLGTQEIMPLDLRRRMLLSALNQRPNDLDLLMTMGQTTKNNGYQKNDYDHRDEPDWQLRWYQAAIAARPASAMARNNFGAALSGKGQFEEAIPFFKKAVELDPQYAGAQMNLATVLSYRGQWKDSFTCFNKAIELDPKNAVLRFNLGNTFLAVDQIDQAIGCFHKAIELDPKNAAAHAGLGSAFIAKSQTEDAILSYQKAIQFNPKDANILNSLGAIFCDKKHDYQAAMGCFQRALQLDPKNATLRTNLGNTLLAMNQFDQAVDCYKKALELDPTLVFLHNSLGIIYVDQKNDFDAAIACFNTTLKLNPKDTTARRGLKITFMKRSIQSTGKNRLDEALADIHQAIQIDPNDARANCILGDVLSKKGQIDEAIACYEKALQLDPKLDYARKSLFNGLKNKGQFLCHDQQDFDGAIPYLKKAIEMEPNDVSPYPYLGRALKEKDRRNEAQTYYLQFAQRDPKNPTHLDALATALKSYGQNDDALIWFQKTTELDSKNARAHSNLACCAVLEASREVSSEGKPDAEERVRLRNKAITALNTARGLYAKQMETGKPEEHSAALMELIHWKEEVFLDAVRNADALSKLQEEERKKWQAFWAELDALLAKSKGK